MVLDTAPPADDDGLTMTQERYPLLELWARADQLWDEIFQLEQSASLDDNADDSPSNTKKASLIVAHGSLGQALLGTAMGWDATRFCDHEFPNCGMAEIEWNFDNGSATNKESPTRPLATRWRWKWPVPSQGWSSLLERPV
jgi:broad specificity phosphatase PhoE